MPEHVVFVEMSLTGAGERCLEYATGRGYETTVLAASPTKYGTAAASATRVLQCATRDADALTAAVRALHGKHRIDGVTTTHDLFVPQAATAAAALGLPGMPPEAAANVRNKYRMRVALQQHCPDLNPPFRLVHTEAEAFETAAAWGYPFVAKPQDANDSWNVTRIDSPSQLTDYLHATSTWNAEFGVPVTPGVLLEGYVDGHEYTVDTAQHLGGPLQLLSVSVKEMTVEGQFFAEIGATLPVRGPDADLLFAAVARALGHLRVDCGVVHTECRVADGQVKILEINPRLAGDMMGSHMIELALGDSPVRQVVEAALGNPVPWRPTRQEGSADIGVCMPRTGVFGGIDNLDELRAQPGVEVVGLWTKPGTACHYPPRSNLDLVARVITRATTPEEALEFAKRAAKSARVRVVEP